LRRYNGPGNDVDYATAIAASPDGSAVYVTGPSVGTTTSWDYATIAYDAASGHKLWLKRYNGPGNFVDFPTAIGVSPDGSTVFVTGGSFSAPSDVDYTTIAYTAS
jgi:hypothetical protein